jgi:hypothetical protein
MKPTRTASLVLALIVVLSAAKATAACKIVSYRDHTVHVASHRFGFVDSAILSNEGIGYSTRIHLGPLGDHEIPFTATQGLIGFCIILATLIVLPTALSTIETETGRAMKRL